VIRPLDIGTLRVETNLVLSPMSGVTDCAFRSLVRHCSGAALGLVVSEFVAAEGITRDNQRTLSMLRIEDRERPVSIQIFGSEPTRMADAARVVEQAGADIVDINCGCPAPKVVRRGGGAELMRQTERLESVVRQVREAVSVPVTVKIRAGWDQDSVNAVEVARLVEQAGASALAVHGRTRVQLYNGSADWELVERVAAAVDIPVLGSGDVMEAGTAVERLGIPGVSGLLIGRAALDNPWIFRQVGDLEAGRLPFAPGPADKVAALELFRDLLRETLPDQAFMGRYRGMACRAVKGLPDAAAARRRMGSAASVEEVTQLLGEFLAGADDRTEAQQEPVAEPAMGAG